MHVLTKKNTYDKAASRYSNQAPGARSKIDKYFDGPQLVIVVHCFINPDGSLGGCGKLIPRSLP